MSSNQPSPAAKPLNSPTNRQPVPPFTAGSSPRSVQLHVIPRPPKRPIPPSSPLSFTKTSLTQARSHPAMTCIIESNRTFTLLDCADSGLAISSNILGIATFAIAVLLAYLAFFRDVRDIPTVADDYSNDIRSLHDQLWAIGDIHGQLSKLVQSGNVRISDVMLQSRLQQGQVESLKEARKFLDEYSRAYQGVFSGYFKKRRWLVRLKWLTLQRRVEHFKANASVLRETLTLDLLAVTLNVNMALQTELRRGEEKRGDLEEKVERLEKVMGRLSPEPDRRRRDEDMRPDSPSPGGGLSVPGFFVSAPEGPQENGGITGADWRAAVSRSPSPLSRDRR